MSTTPTPTQPLVPAGFTDINSNSYTIFSTTYYGSLKLYLSEITKLSSEDENISGNYSKYNNDKNIKITLSDTNYLRFNGAYSNIVFDYNSIKDSHETYILINSENASNGYIGIDYCCYTSRDIDESIKENTIENNTTYTFGYIKVDNVNKWYDCKYTYTHQNPLYNPITDNENIAITDSININVGSTTRFNIDKEVIDNYGYLGYIALSDINITYDFNSKQNNSKKIFTNTYFPFGVNKNLLYNKYHWACEWGLDEDINTYFNFLETPTAGGNNYLNFVKPLNKDKSNSNQSITVSSTAFFNADGNGPNIRGDVNLTINANPFNIYVPLPDDTKHWFTKNNDTYCPLHNSEQAQIYVDAPPVDKDGFHATIILSEGYTQAYNDINRCFRLDNSNVSYEINKYPDINNKFDFIIKNKDYNIGNDKDKNQTWGSKILGYLQFEYTYNGKRGSYKRSLYAHIGGITTTTTLAPTPPTTPSR